MQLKLQLLPLLLLFGFSVSAFAQEPPQTAAESLEKLRLQLLEVQTKEEALRVRAQQLEEAAKPENIERSLAGVGSTKPEELRESRRRQLTIEKDGVLAQLKLLEASRQRLETAIANAEGLAYQESARGVTPAGNQMMAASSPVSYRWLMLGGGLVALVLAAGIVLYKRRIKSS